MKRLKQKLKSGRGMSLTELLCAVLILVLVSGGMATAVSLAARQYQQSMRESEAQILCSTLETILRNELAYTTEIKLNGDKVEQFQSQTYAIKDSLSSIVIDDPDEKGYGRLLLGNDVKNMDILGRGAYPHGLLVKIDENGFTYDNSTHCFTVKLSVGCDGKDYATREFQVLNANLKQVEPQS